MTDKVDPNPCPEIRTLTAESADGEVAWTWPACRLGLAAADTGYI